MNEHTKRGRAEAPEPAPPAFHRVAKRKPAKPWVVQWRVNWSRWGREWITIGRYHRREAAEQAAGSKRRYGMGEYRIIGPDGES